MSWVYVTYDDKLWVPIPVGDNWMETEWGSEKDWGRSAAHVLMAFNDMPEERRALRRLSKTLIAYRQTLTESGLGREYYLYFSDLREAPLSLTLWYGSAEGELEATLRKHAHADSQETMRDPQVEEFVSENLGKGLRALNHVLLEDNSIAVNLWYALRDEKHGVDVIAFASTGDLGRLVAAEADFDDFVRSIVVADEESAEHAVLGDA